MRALLDLWRARSEDADTRPVAMTTLSGEPVAPLYTAADRAGVDEVSSLGVPGEFPFTRGVYPAMYRSRLWTTRLFSGFGTAEETNARYRALLEAGQDGLSVAVDLPTLMGVDSDDPRALGEVGRCGVAVDTLEDFRILFDDIPTGEITTSMTINSPASILLAMYVSVGEEQGFARHRLGGTIQNDMLKEYHAQKEYFFPPRPSMRIVADMMRFTTAEMPRWHPVSVSGYHIREAGSTAAQELAFTLADGFAYVELGEASGMSVDDFAPRLSFFFNAHLDFFEEIAKYRAARRIWSRWLRDRYGAKSQRSLLMRFHTQTAGVSLTAQQPYNNVVRTTVEALAAVFGGTQSLHTNSLDETLALPTARAAKLALRTQQILAYEHGLTNVVDPLGGSYYLESLTDRIEARAEEYFAKILEMGGGSILEGVYAGIESGWFQVEIADASYRLQREYEAGSRKQVGVNVYVEADDEELEVLEIGPEAEVRQQKRLAEVKATRDAARVETALTAVRAAAADPTRNLMPPLIDAVRAHATVGELMQTMAGVFGRYAERPVL
ncbi:MAG: methylmalonyl-CoA mutase [Acidimicrobiia bacterium]|nr:methylmalonyl-CoA mutase [Acidimicrobiia bacterium]